VSAPILSHRFEDRQVAATLTGFPLEGLCPKKQVRSEGRLQVRTYAGPISGASSTIRGWVGRIVQKFCSKSAASKSLICSVILCIHSLSTTGFLHPRTHLRDGDDSPEIWRNCRRRRSLRQYAPNFLGKAPRGGEGRVHRCRRQFRRIPGLALLLSSGGRDAGKPSVEFPRIQRVAD